MLPDSTTIATLGSGVNGHVVTKRQIKELVKALYIKECQHTILADDAARKIMAEQLVESLTIGKTDETG